MRTRGNSLCLPHWFGTVPDLPVHLVRVGSTRKGRVEDRVAERGELVFLVRVLNHAGRAYSGVYEQRVVGWLRGTDAVRLFAEFLNRFREFSEPFISPLVELPVKRRDEGVSQGAADNRDEVQPGFDCPFGDLPAADSFVGDR